MIHIEKFVFNPFRENTYILSDSTGQCIIIDAGCQEKTEKEELIGYISSGGLKPVSLVNTHCHIDHILGVAFLAGHYGIPFYIHADEKALLTHSRNQAELFGLSLEDPPEPAGFLEEGGKLEIGEYRMDIIHIPGHSPGGILFHSPEQKILIAGDVLFSQSIGRTDLPGGDYDGLVTGIREKLMVLDPETVVYPGHGTHTTIGEEKSMNPFLT